MASIDLYVTPLLCAALFALALFDVRTRRLPDALTLPLLALGLILAGLRESGFPVTEVIGAVAGYAAFAALGSFFYRWRGIDGLGLGDAKLLAAAGAWLGWPVLPGLVLTAAVGALTMALVTGVGRRTTIAFGPWLAGAFAFFWFWKVFTGSTAISPHLLAS